MDGLIDEWIDGWVKGESEVCENHITIIRKGEMLCDNTLCVRVCVCVCTLTGFP